MPSRLFQAQRAAREESMKPQDGFDLATHGNMGSLQDIAAQTDLDTALGFLQPEQRDQYGQIYGGTAQAGDFATDDASIQAAIQAATGAPPEQPERFGNDMAWLDEMFQQDPGAAMREAQAMGTSADPALAKQQADFVAELQGRGLTADQGSRDAQQRAVDELFGLYQQGGLGAQDRAARAKARGESENWLRGQREASRQSLAQRGMLGSGADLLMDLGDSQAAATRLSQADLQTSADAERRALDALLAGGDLSTTMRNQADQYKMGNTSLAGGMLSDMRNASDNYVQDNADRIAKVRNDNVGFLRDSYTDMIRRRNEWDTNVFNTQVGAADNKALRDQSDNATGYGQGTDLAASDAGAYNSAKGAYNANTLGAFSGASPAVANAGAGVVGLTGNADRAAGNAFSEGFNAAANVVSSIYGGGGGIGGGQKKKEG